MIFRNNFILPISRTCLTLTTFNYPIVTSVSCSPGSLPQIGPGITEDKKIEAKNSASAKITTFMGTPWSFLCSHENFGLKAQYICEI